MDELCTGGNEKVGINVEFVAVPRSDEIDKMTSMMAGGIAPDNCVDLYLLQSERLL